MKGTVMKEHPECLVVFGMKKQSSLPVKGSNCRLMECKSSHEPCDGAGQEVLIAHAYVAGHAGVLLTKGLGRALQLSAHLNKGVKLEGITHATDTVTVHQVLNELRAQVITQLREC